MCTTIIVGRKATVDGSVMVAHSDDNELSDQRLIYVPGQEIKPGSQRDILPEHNRYPRIVSDQRGPGYETTGYPATKPIGHVPWERLIANPEVNHTFAYFDGNYGICNEHNLMLGECTNGAKYQPERVTAEEAKKTGQHIRIFYSAELSRIALECCRTAREAINLMGGLIDEYGYYSTGETLLLVDENEGWVFEMCALPDDRYHSVWIAQRVPDDEFFVAANEFRIREIDHQRPDDFIHCKTLFKGLEKVGYFDPDDGPLDWLRAVSYGEYNHPYYSLRRVWRVLDRVNPDLGLSPWVRDGFTKDYPFSIKPNRKLSATDIFALYRDHYEGTQFDLTKGIAAGPYGDPHRFTAIYDGAQNNITADKQYFGAWERAISVFYQGYTFVGQIRCNAPEATKGVLWFGPDVSYTTCFTPFFTKINHRGLPQSYQTGDPQKLDWDVAWWIFDFVGNWCRLNFQRMTQVDIQPLQAELEQFGLDGISRMDDKVGAYPEDAIRLITEFCAGHATEVVACWKDLAHTLVAKYADGYLNLPGKDGAAVGIGYPSTWLKVTDYKKGPTSYDMKPLKAL